MGYKQNLHPSVSNAEIEIFKGLSQRGLTLGMVTQKPIILKATIPDFMWAEKRKVVYLDGEQVHRDKQEWDEEVQVKLENYGWQVLRVSYYAPLTKERTCEILNQIAVFLGSDM